MRQFRWLKLLLGSCTLAAMMTTANATPILDADCPLNFFTNAASRLLTAQFNLDASRIQISPTNQYTPAVHWIFQLVANVYEATSTNPYPAVFRPIFLVTNNPVSGYCEVYICGYEPVGYNGQIGAVSGPADPQLTLPVDVASLSPGGVLPGAWEIYTNINVYGVPWIIGAKKGFPNFNEFAMESTFQLTRKLELTRDSTNDTFRVNPSAYHFNQMFNLSVSNQFGAECWNSYTNYFPDTVSIYVTDANSGVLSNDENFSTLLTNYIFGSLVISNSTNWPGYNLLAAPLTTPASFQIPLAVSVTGITNSTYRFNGGAPFLTTNLELPYETGVNVDGNPYPQPHWWLVNTNDIRVVMLDGPLNGPDHVIDYVQLSGPNTIRDLTSEIITNYDIPAALANASPNELWNTNYQAGMPISIVSQFLLAQGAYGKTASPSAPNLTWNPVSDQRTQNAIDAFRVFLGLAPLWNNPSGAFEFAVAAATNAWASPYQPVATVVQHVDLEANDPLVHYLASDLNWSGALQYDTAQVDLTSNNTSNLGQLNARYMPWGGHQPLNTWFMDFNTVNAYNLAIKDPLVWQSDYWNFPTNESLSGQWLGHVHRGTPWQTIYLKTSDILAQTNASGIDIGTNVWMTWTGDTNTADAAAMAPVQDWHLASLMAYLMNTNDLTNLFSVNASAPNGWPGVLNSLTALTNTASDSQLAAGATPRFAPLVVSSNSPQASFIANAVQSAQSGQPGHFFNDVGDILSIPQLTEQSPFLNWNDVIQQEYGISDEAYEILPSQLLPLLRADSIGSVSLANGRVIARFSGYDNHLYALEVSTNLSDWVIMSINFSLGGGFGCTNAAPLGSGPQFFRSMLVQ